jgi:hypothetical protein
VLKLDTALKAGKFLVVVHGTTADVEKARAILSARGASDVSHTSEAAKTTVG